MSHTAKSSGNGATRRDFLKVSTTAAVATAAVRIPGAHAAGSDRIRVGVIGCGGRGTGAAANVLAADPATQIVALGDVFKDRVESCRKKLAEGAKAWDNEGIKDTTRCQVADELCFNGLDAYEKVLATDVDYVILATPPAFRPQCLKAAVAAGKNIFTEKPVAVDGPGIRTCLEVYEQAKAKGLAIVAGTQRRHKAGYVATLGRVADGAIGEVVAARAYWNQGALWVKPRRPDWSGLEWQIRNWLYFTWLSGDHIVEQHVHNLDVVNWAMGTHPVKAVGLGGRQVRVEPEYGHIFDHFAVDYEYENGAHMMSMCRQIDGCASSVSEALVGTLGTCDTVDGAGRYVIKGKNPWRFEGEERNPYEQEHVDLIASIRSGKPLNELKRVAESTLTAIMGRMSTYSGKALTWDEALGSKESLVLASLDWGPIPVPPVAMPGQSRSG